MAQAAEAVGRLPEHDVLVDFDYTLFGSNSTEAYLAAARPAFLASFLLFLLRGIFPWQRMFGDRWYRVRDYVAVVAMTLLMPWNLVRWRRHAPTLFRRHCADALVGALATIGPARVTIVSFGFDMLIAPLLRGSPLGGCRRICVPFLINPLRLRHGKLVVVEREFGPARLARAALVTDSMDDADVLDRVAHPILIEPTGNPLTAEETMYLPLRYTARAKYDARFVRQQVFTIEFVIVLLAIAGSALHSWTVIPAAFLLFVSNYAIYEIGYHENDHVAALSEAKPVLSARAAAYADHPLERNAWAWALALGMAGCALQVLGSGGDRVHGLATATAWIGMLGVTRTIFYVYNRRAPPRRMLLYPALQAAKLFGVFVVLVPSLFGVALAFAQVVMMWMNYAIYRAGGDKSAFPREGVRLVAFVLLGCGIVAARGLPLAPLEAGIAALMLAWAAGRLVASKLSRPHR